MTDRLQTILDELRSCTGDRQRKALWSSAFSALKKTDLPAGRVTNVVAARDLEGLQRLVDSLSGDTAAETPSSEPQKKFDEETLKKAMRAFRKRLKLTRLDHESRLGRSPLTSGRKAEVDAILPPHEFPAEIWPELVRLGRLKSMGGGFYELADERPHD